MLTFDRVNMESEILRPETSKLSRSSARPNIYNVTMTNFNSKQASNLQGKDIKPFDKTDQQINPNTKKGIPNKKPLMSATFYESSNAKPKIQKQDPFAAFDKPNAETKEEKQNMVSSKGFNITNNDLKEGTTLDKVLGGGFKKIDIFSSVFKGSEIGDPFPTGAIDEELDHDSENGGYNYESFEILETENEEEAFGESNGGFGRKQSRKRGRQPCENFQEVGKHSEIRDKINKKYRHKVPSIKQKLSKVYRSPEPFVNEPTDFSKAFEENDDRQKASRFYDNADNAEITANGMYPSNLKEINYNQNHAVMRKDTGSRSISPHEGRGRIDTEKRIERFQGSFYDGNKSSKGSINNQFSGSRQNFNKNETSNPFRTSNTGFKKKIYEEHQRESSVDESGNRQNSMKDRGFMKEDMSSKMRTSGMKQSFINAYGADLERDKRQRGENVIGAESSKMRDTGTRFHVEKIGLQSFNQKNPLENNRIAERIKQHEQDMLNKYASKRYPNQDDRYTIGRFDENVGSTNRRLSTPVRDNPSIGSFGIKKFVGKM